MNDELILKYRKTCNETIEEINDKRNYVIKYNDKNDLIDYFEKNNKILLNIQNQYNNDVINFRYNGLRIMTYNVHFGTNHKTESNLKNILELIEKINPDILCLNEITTNTTEYNDSGFPNTIGNLINFSFCSITPSWFYSPYGTSVYIKSDLIKHLYLINTPNCNNPTKKNCDLKQKIKTFNLNETTNDVESRCYIKFSLKDFDIICVHLEPYSKDIRIEQLKEINNDITRKTIILGDFNIFNEEDFKEEILREIKDKKKLKQKFTTNKNKYSMKKLLKSIDYKPRQTTDEMNMIKNKFKWIDSFELANMIPISYTNWTGIRVDYVFFTKEWVSNDILFSRTYFTNESDHLPIICDILNDFYFDIKYDIDYYDEDLRTKDDINKTDIEILTYVDKNNEEPMLLDHDKFLNYYQQNMNNVKNKKMSTGGQIDSVKNINEIFFYNGQTSNNISWFKKQPTLEPNENYEYKDPTMSSNEPKQINLGGYGLYATDSIDFSLRYAVQFTKKEVNKNSFPIIFIFKTNLSEKDIKKLKIGMINYRLTSRNYRAEEFDNNFHIMFLNDRTFQHNAIQIKFTRLFFRDFRSGMELIKILNLGDDKYENIYYENDKKYELPYQKIFDTSNINLIYKYLTDKYNAYNDDQIKQRIENDIESKKLEEKCNNFINIHIKQMIGGIKSFSGKFYKYYYKNNNDS